MFEPERLAEQLKKQDWKDVTEDAAFFSKQIFERYAGSVDQCMAKVMNDCTQVNNLIGYDLKAKQ